VTVEQPHLRGDRFGGLPPERAPKARHFRQVVEPGEPPSRPPSNLSWNRSSKGKQRVQEPAIWAREAATRKGKVMASAAKKR
jgi:hypothetical protein